jgi:hypothetical protein
VKKGGARLLGRAAVRPFYNIINGLKFRLQAGRQKAILPPEGYRQLVARMSPSLARWSLDYRSF